MTQTTDSFITQAEALIESTKIRLETGRNPSGRQVYIADDEDRMRDLATALRSLLGEYKRLTAEQEWEYAQSEVLTDGTTAYGMPVATLQEAVRRRDIDRINYPWPEEIGVGRRRKAGPWVPVEGEDQ